MSLTIEVPLSLGMPLKEVVEHAQKLEAMGFDGIATSDHLERFGRDAYVALALVAANTSRIRFGPRATNPVTRHPFVMATMANTLNELAPGRVRLSMATGDRGIHPTGRKPATVAAMREAVTSMQRLLRGETVASPEGGPPLTIDAVAPPPSIGITASGRRMMELAGEVADEALILAGLDSRILAVTRQHLETSARRAGRPLEGFRVAHYVVLSLDDDITVARERVRRSLHTWLRQGLLNVALEAVGLEVPAYERPEDIPDDLFIRLCDLLFVVGRPGECTERLQELSSRGVKHISCMIAGGPPVAGQVLELLSKQVLPLVR